MRSRRLFWVAVFALAMAFLEAAVVVYLRRVLGVVDLLRDTGIYDESITRIELAREAATLVMLLSLGFAVGRSLQARLGFALFAFGLWDVLYYVWLVVLLRWPASILEEDVLFLIPLPWWGPVLAPVLIALLLMALGVVLVDRDGAGKTVRFLWTEWAALLGGTILVLYTFMADALRVLPASAEDLSRLKPTAFGWGTYLIGFAALVLPVWRAARRATHS
jgi:hypothetical protein